METRWLYRTAGDFDELRKAACDTCVIPMGCVEKHGIHLPLGTDIIHSSHIAYMASQLETVCVFPDFVFGDVPEAFPNMPAGSITLPVDTEMLLLEQLCEQIARHGYRKILVYNGHGGNGPWLSTFLRKLANKQRNFVLATCMMKLPVPHKMAEMILEKGRGCIPELSTEDEDLILKYHEQGMKIGHGCMSETAFVMGVAPEAVHLDLLGIEDGQSTHVADYFAEAGLSIRCGGFERNYPNRFGGDDPVGCNERIAKAALRLEAERLAHAIKVYKEDEKLWNWLQEDQQGW